MPHHHTEIPRFSDAAARALAEDLQPHIRGEVRFRNEDRALYAADSSNYRQVPIGVVIPRNADDVVETMAICRKHGAPVLSRGCGTSLSGETCNVAVIIDFSKYLNNIIEITPDSKSARVQPGVIFEHAREAVQPHGLTIAFDTSTHAWATIGGMIGNNSCGVHSVLAEKMGAGSGRTEDNIHEMEILTYDGLRMRVGKTSNEQLEAYIREGGRRGEIYGKLKALRDKYGDLIRKRYPSIPRRVSGYNLPQLLPEHHFNVARALVGTEGTCVTVLEADIGLVENPLKRALLVLGYKDIYTSGDHVMDVRRSGPVGLEALDNRLIENMHRKHMAEDDLKLLPQGGGWLLAEFGGSTEEEAAEQAKELIARLTGKPDAPDMRLFTSPSDQERIWKIRESGLGATAYVPGRDDNFPGWEDSAVPPERVGDYLRDLKSLFHRYGYDAALYGHYGQGCIHCRINFDVRSEEGVKTWRKFLDDAADLVVSYGGSFSGEHGDGQARAELLPKLYGAELVEAFREFKHIWDPHGKMNPGKVVDPYPITSNLRYGPDFRPPDIKTHYAYPDDKGSFARAVMRCVGVGQCRKHDDQVMCPSFMVTHDEEYTTRGRARSLFEMMRGGVVKDGWKDEGVREALDLCLACKGCKGDCPVNVDMATYKSEFMSHYYEGRLRPRHMYSMGLIYWWARAASHVPGIANFFSQTAPFAGLLKKAGGIAPQRDIPAFAAPTWREWYRKRAGHKARRPRTRGGASTAQARGLVLVWPDTFTNFLTPEPGKAAVEVLEALGYETWMPRRPLCCGRPLYDAGMLDTAKRLWRQILDELRPYIREGVPLVGVEPSCVAAFRDELINLFPEDKDAQRLSKQTFMLSEFLLKEGYEPPRLKEKALVHYHCNHHAVMGKTKENLLLQKMGLDFEDSRAGCCGMAGPFGFEEQHYDISAKCAERKLLPKVRGKSKDTLLIANGFSCREQIAQMSGQKALHISQVLKMAMEREGSIDSGPRGAEDRPYAISDKAALALCGASLGLIAAGLMARRR